MPLLRVASLAILALWLGGLSVLVGVASPSVTAVLAQQEPAAGGALANAIIGDTFQRFQYLSWYLGGILMALLGLRAALGPRPRLLAVQVWLVAAMLAASAFVLSAGLVALTLGAGLAVFWIEAKD